MCSKLRCQNSKGNENLVPIHTEYLLYCELCNILCRYIFVILTHSSCDHIPSNIYNEQNFAPQFYRHCKLFTPLHAQFNRQY